MSYTAPNHMPYFYGRLLRDESNRILKQRGCIDGLFLLRERIEETGSYTLSVCFENEINHYKINRQEDGTVKMDKGNSFIGPVELVNHHKNVLDGLVTKLLIPCDRPAGIQPVFYLSIYYSGFHQLVENEIKKNCKTAQALENARGCLRYIFEKKVLKQTHLTQSWFFKELERDRASHMLQQSGMQNGKYLIRYTSRDNAYKISLCYGKEVKHYKINCYNDKYSFEGGREFDTIIQLVDYYHRCSDGLVEKLLIPYLPKSKTEKLSNKDELYEANQNYLQLINNILPETVYVDDEPRNSKDFEDLRNIPQPKRALFEDNDNYIYETEMNFIIDRNDIVLYDVLGEGNFGSVKRGVLKIQNNEGIKEQPVAIKSLKGTSNKDAENEFFKEAEIMKSLEHKHVIKLIGISFDSNSQHMIVLELAKLGPLHKYLQNHKELKMNKIIRLMYQVASAMEYLSSMHIVHRDLAARNVLLASEDLAKVTDFGLSRTINENSYYITKSEGKWPLKWYPPETSTDYKFDEKSDVWSFGITCWEATSYGSRPYQGISIDTLVTRLENGHRLDKPEHCPDDVYNLMYSCWNANKYKRPKFSDIVKEMTELIRT